MFPHSILLGGDSVNYNQSEEENQKFSCTALLIPVVGARNLISGTMKWYLEASGHVLVNISEGEKVLVPYTQITRIHKTLIWYDWRNFMVPFETLVAFSSISLVFLNYLSDELWPNLLEKYGKHSWSIGAIPSSLPLDFIRTIWVDLTLYTNESYWCRTEITTCQICCPKVFRKTSRPIFMRKR